MSRTVLPVHAFAIAVFALLCSAAPARADTVSVLGVTLGASTPADVRSMVQAHDGRVSKEDTSVITGGPLLEVRGDLGLEGLTRTLFLFDTDQRLSVVAMTLAKHRFDAVLDTLKRKHRYVSGKRPFVGDAEATLRSGAVQIRLEAPHLSFDMSLVYATDTAWAQYSEYHRREAEARRMATESRL